ncbi:Pex5 protein [Pichia kluyveri]|uniref:Peroxisomal targeting signal receptor n=1 Tax=Pichia kluyveri TaxID=36015 RepID=A0AAV5RDB9_PICKL|nr:Pex5 protein [Pichia kluyveri]
MSFLAGGSDCASSANPLAQLAKRPDVDTSLQSGLRNAASNGQNAHNLHGIHSQQQMSSHNMAMLDSFKGDHLSAPPMGSFDFAPVHRELNNISLQPQMGLNNNLSTAPHAANWSQEFNTTTATVTATAPIVSNNINNTSQQSYSPMSQMGNMGPMMRGSSMYAMRNNMMMNNHQLNPQSQQQSQSNTQSMDANTLSQAEWDDKFKEFEQSSEINEIPEVLYPNDEKFSMPHSMPSFHDKYHDEYQFEEKNEFLNNPNAYEIGCKLMEGGAKLSEAALAFEAAVQSDPKHVDAWLKLGQVQIQNEKELSGITAIENCLLIDDKNLTALMDLAISYVNEGYDNAAFKTFENWIETKYPDIVSRARLENPNDISDDRYSLNKRITNLFLKAAQLSPSGVNVDADVQTGLGVLFYSMEDYDKTLDCFQAAIRCNPNDALSWNRLGASYANSNRPEQAIESYSKALQLNPNFVRARYNLGVSFINMGMYKDAVDQLLTGLSMHEIESPNGDTMLVSDTEQSSNLIETLKRAFLAMDRRDLIDKVRPGMNVAQFRSEFKV